MAKITTKAEYDEFHERVTGEIRQMKDEIAHRDRALILMASVLQGYTTGGQEVEEIVKCAMDETKE